MQRILCDTWGSLSTCQCYPSHCDPMRGLPFPSVAGMQCGCMCIHIVPLDRAQCHKYADLHFAAMRLPPPPSPPSGNPSRPAFSQSALNTPRSGAESHSTEPLASKLSGPELTKQAASSRAASGVQKQRNNTAATAELWGGARGVCLADMIHVPISSNMVSTFYLPLRHSLAI